MEKLLQTEQSVFELMQSAGIKVLQIFRAANGYWPSSYPFLIQQNPWWIIKTPAGLIKIGKRKRVTEISWECSDIRAIITDDNVTKTTTCVHAWGSDKLLEYLKTLGGFIKNQPQRWPVKPKTLQPKEKKLSRETIKALFDLAEIPVHDIFELENVNIDNEEPPNNDLHVVEQNRRIQKAIFKNSHPWWLIQTNIGLVRISWQNSSSNFCHGIRIDWTDTVVRLVVTEDRTEKEENYVVAQSLPDALKYLTTWNSEAKIYEMAKSVW